MSGASRPPEDWRTEVASDPTFNGQPLVRLSEIEPIEPKFVEYPLLQAAMFHLVAGKPGVGKGALCTRWIARCTNGDMYGEPRRALWLSSEEDAARDLRPRLDVAGADTSRVALIPDRFRLPDHVEWLHERIEKEGEVGLVVIDPISNHIHRTNSSMEEEVREALQPLARLAADLDILMLGIRHISTKEGRGNFLARILGATGFVGVSRAVLGVAQDREGTVHVRAIKGNRVPISEAGKRFRLQSIEYRDWQTTVVRAVDDGTSLLDLDDLVSMVDHRTVDSNSEMARGEVLRILREHGGVCESDKLDAEIAEETGLKVKTIRNLRIEMKDRGWLRAFPEKDEETGQVLRWMISLTNAAPFPEVLASASPQSYQDNARARTPDGRGGSGDLQEEILTLSGSGFGPVEEPEPTTDIGPSGSGDLQEEPKAQPSGSGSEQAVCPTCGSTNIGFISGRCHACGSKVHEPTL
jgi:AAA domain